MKRRFAVFDIDGTLIRWQLYHAIVEDLIAHHKLPESMCKSIDEARLTWKRRQGSTSFQEYEHHLWQSYVAAVATLSVKDIDATMNAVFETYKDQVYTYTRDLIRQLKRENYLLFAVSGSHQEIVEKLGNYYGFDAVRGTQYPHDNVAFTGEEITVVPHKDEALKQLVAEQHASWQGSIGIGDSKSDASMLHLVEHPIAFNPNAELFAIARDNGWKVVLERKNMVYKMENTDGHYLLAETDH